MILEYLLRIPEHPRSPVARFVDWLVGETTAVVVHFYVDEADAASRVLEETKTVSLGGPYSATKHPPHVPSGEHHLHVYARQGQLFALNRGGTAHDQSHEFRIPNRVAVGIRKHFPDFRLPPDNMIEAATPAIEVLIEEFFRERSSTVQGLAD